MKLLFLSLILIAAPILIANANAWKFCAVGDITTTTITNAVKAQDCKVHLALGDYYGNYKLLKPGLVESGVTLLAACGNHDSCSKVLSNDGQSFTSYPIGYKYQNIGFLVLNTETTIAKQKSAAETILQGFQSDSSIKGIIITEHMPAVTNPSAHHKESDAAGYRTQFTIWKSTFTKLVAAYFGHNHGYQNCFPVSPAMTITTDGTGGRTPYPWGSTMDDGCTNNLSGSKYNGYSIAEVTNSSITTQHISLSGPANNSPQVVISLP